MSFIGDWSSRESAGLDLEVEGVGLGGVDVEVAGGGGLEAEASLRTYVDAVAGLRGEVEIARRPLDDRDSRKKLPAEASANAERAARGSNVAIVGW